MDSPDEQAEPPEAGGCGDSDLADRVPPCAAIHRISTDFWGIIWCHCPRCRGKGELCLAEVILRNGGEGGD